MSSTNSLNIGGCVCVCVFTALSGISIIWLRTLNHFYEHWPAQLEVCRLHTQRAKCDKPRWSERQRHLARCSVSVCDWRKCSSGLWCGSATGRSARCWVLVWPEISCCSRPTHWAPAGRKQHETITKLANILFLTLFTYFNGFLRILFWVVKVIPQRPSCPAAGRWLWSHHTSSWPESPGSPPGCSPFPPSHLHK